MGPEQFREFINRRPFVPLRVHLSDGTKFEIRHPELVVVARRYVALGIAENGDTGIIDRQVFYSYLHIVQVEELAVQPHE